MINQLTVIGTVFFLILSLAAPQAFAFEANSINMTLQDAFVDEYENFDIITAIFSIFNGDSQDAYFTGHNMLYLNDTNGDWWEYSNHADLANYTATDCPSLNTTIPAGNTTNVRLCYLVTPDDTIGFSLIVNSFSGLMDMDIKEFELESVPSWFKTTASAWCTGSIPDADYFNSVEFNVQKGIIGVLRGQSEIDLGAQTPDWVKNTACDWSNNQISDYEFLDGIYWLIDNGKVQLN